MNPIAVDRLQSQLLTSGLSQRDQPLYQVISQLIGYVRQLIDETQGSLNTITGGGTSPGQTFVTTENELSSLPNSRRLVPGVGVHFNNDGQRLVIGSSPIPGITGEDGEEGPMGVPGIQGPIGPTGATGPAGAGGGMPLPWDYFEELHDNPALMTLLNANSIPETAIQDGTILARVAANESITGQWVINNPVFSQNAASTPQWLIIDNSGAVDEKIWRHLESGGQYLIQGVNDAFTVAFTSILLQRIGASPARAFIYGGLVLPTQTGVISITADQTAWNPTGLSTSFYLLVNATAPWTLRGITAQANGTIILIRNNGANQVSFTHEDGAAPGVNRIWTPAAISPIGINQFSCITLYYDGLVGRWIVQSWT